MSSSLSRYVPSPLPPPQPYKPISRQDYSHPYSNSTGAAAGTNVFQSSSQHNRNNSSSPSSSALATTTTTISRHHQSIIPAASAIDGDDNDVQQLISTPYLANACLVGNNADLYEKLDSQIGRQNALIVREVIDTITRLEGGKGEVECFVSKRKWPILQVFTDSISSKLDERYFSAIKAINTNFEWTPIQRVFYEAKYFVVEIKAFQSQIVLLNDANHPENISIEGPVSSAAAAAAAALTLHQKRSKKQSQHHRVKKSTSSSGSGTKSDPLIEISSTATAVDRHTRHASRQKKKENNANASASGGSGGGGIISKIFGFS